MMLTESTDREQYERIRDILNRLHSDIKHESIMEIVGWVAEWREQAYRNGIQKGYNDGFQACLNRYQQWGCDYL